MGERACSVLFLGTGNATRSIMAEALLRHHAGDRFVVHSAGTHPTWRINHMALDTLTRRGIVDTTLRSAALDEYTAADAPILDFVFTVSATAREAILADRTTGKLAGSPLMADWRIDDPASLDAGELERLMGFREAFRILERRVLLFVNLPMQTLDRAALQARVDEIGRDLGRD